MIATPKMGAMDEAPNAVVLLRSIVTNTKNTTGMDVMIIIFELAGGVAPRDGIKGMEAIAAGEVGGKIAGAVATVVEAVAEEEAAVEVDDTRYTS
jgi:hypothetical protein